MKKSFFIYVAVLYLAYTAWSQEIIIPSTHSIDDELNRPSVALVLAGGGARGFSHIPVIELMEELGIPIDMVIGTSAGAIVGGLYSAGYSGSQIAEQLLYLDWPTLFQDATTQPLESALGSHSIDASIASVQLKRDLSLDLGKGLLSGQYVYNIFKSLTAKIPSYIHFDSLITPFRATAVDLLTGEMVVMEQGDLTEAIRASMSIPAVFEPFPIDGRYYMDGFTRNNLPIRIAKDLGYDIIIAVEITDRLSDDVETFDSNPLTALNQVIALQQTVVVSEEYELADLILYPDIYEYGQMDYDSAADIYEKGKKEAEKYRDALLELRSTIFPSFEAGEQSVLVEDTDALDDNEFTFTFVTTDTALPYTRENTYAALPEIEVKTIVLKNVLPKDEHYIRENFYENNKGVLDGAKIEKILDSAYKTGNYILVTARIDKLVVGNSLELEFFPKIQQAVYLNTAGTFEGSLSNDSTWALNLATTLQFRDLNAAGGIISLKGSYLNTTGIEIMYMQPVSQKVFLQAKANVLNILDVRSSGFTKIDVSGSQLRHANISLACGIFFSPEHKLFNEFGFRWVDSSLSNNDDILLGQNVNLLEAGYSLDVLSRYTFSTLDYSVFPTRGFYNDLNVLGVMPLKVSPMPIIFDVVSTDFIFALPFSQISSMVLNAFVGTNISQGLNNNLELITQYGFTTYDRTFFSHVMQRETYGIHKLALKLDFQFQPKRQLTLLGGQFFAGFGGAVGGVWDDYSTLSELTDIEWQASALSGLRIKESIGLLVRAGAGRYNEDVRPFVSFDFKIKHY